MSKPVRIGIAMVLAAVALLIFVSGAYSMLPKGNKAPGFSLPALDGKTISLSTLQKDPADKSKTRVVLLDFWATWCPPCREYVPQLQKLHEKYAKQGLAIVGIALDRDGDKAVKQFVKDKKLTYTVLLDSGREAAKLYQVSPIPQTYIIDRDGVIRHTHLGYYPGMGKDLEKEIKALLK